MKVKNKFKLISDIYLHYISIDAHNKLSLILESCLCDFLRIANNNKILRSVRYIHDTVDYYIYENQLSIDSSTDEELNEYFKKTY